MAEQLQDDGEAPRIEGYSILREIGRGGMGSVFVARQEALNRLVAVKVLALNGGPDLEERLARFRREAELMARVHHPNVLTIFDYGTVDGRPYLVTEYVESGDLRQYMTPGYPMPVAQARAILRPVGEALACLHRHGILHRDLKPENILMRDEGNPVVGDFGIAVLGSGVNLLTRSGQSLGTPGYAAPEQQYRLGVDERSDQYSLASLAYELLTGQRPLGIFPTPSGLNPRLRPQVDEVLRRALQDDPADRYPRIREFIEELDLSLSNRRPAPPARRRLGWSSAVVALVLIGAAILWALGPRGTDPTGANAAETRTDLPGNPVPDSGTVPVPDRTRNDQPIVETISEISIDELPETESNSLGMQLILVRPGEFLMGSPESDPLAREAETPQVPVWMDRPFYLARTEVTLGQFRAFIEQTGYVTDAERHGGGKLWVEEQQKLIESPELDWENPGVGSATDDLPALQVSWNDANAFCDWLTGQEGRTYRLPTEEEWEFACRAGTETRWSFGDDPALADPHVWHFGNSPDGPRPVGTRQPNPWGLCDMHGNAQEWALNSIGNLPNREEGKPDPTRNRLLRGGCWHWGLDGARSATRFAAHATHRSATAGFRVCRPIFSSP